MTMQMARSIWVIELQVSMMIEHFMLVYVIFLLVQLLYKQKQVYLEQAVKRTQPIQWQQILNVNYRHDRTLYLNNIDNKSRIIVLCVLFIVGYSTTNDLSLNLFSSIFGYSCLNDAHLYKLFNHHSRCLLTIPKPLLCAIPTMNGRRRSTER
jgi:hypothetical protein